MANPQRLVVILVFALALTGGVVLALNVLGGGAGSSPSPVAELTPSPTAEPAMTPTAAPSPSESSAPPSSSPSPTPAATPRPTAAPGEPTVVVITELKLDAKDDPEGVNRRVRFEAQGSGVVTAAVRVLSPQGSAVMCLAKNDNPRECTTTAAGTLTASASRAVTDFLLTLRGEGIETPMVEVTLTFPAATPSIAVENARFDGTQWPDTNGLQVFLAPRSDGDVTLDASWGGHPFDYEVDLLEQGGPGSHVISGEEANVGVQATLPVTAGKPWKLVLQNVDDGFGITLLDATIGWP
jgi:hypothetical protein